MKIYKLLFLLSTIWLSGCQLMQHHSGITTKGIPPNNGLVIGSVISNSDALSRYHSNWTEIVFYSIPEEGSGKKSETFSIYAYKDDQSRTSFYGQIPPGKYFYGLLLTTYNTNYISAWMNTPSMYSSMNFEVKTNEITDLGTIIYQPLENTAKANYWQEEKEKEVSGYVTRVNHKNKHIIPVILDKHRAVPRNLASLKVNYPESPNLNQINQDLLALSKENAWKVSIKEFANEQKTIISTGKLGTYSYKTNASKSWSYKSLPVLDEVKRAFYINGQYIFVTELGENYVSQNLQDTPSKLDLAKYGVAGKIKWLGANTSEVYALSEDDDFFYAYRLKEITSPWNEIGRFKKGFTIGSPPAKLAMLDDNNQFVLILDGDTYNYSAKTSKWKKKHTEDFDGLYKQKDGTIIGMSDGFIQDSYPYISYDFGQTWTKVDRPFFSGAHKAKRSPVYTTKDGTVYSLGTLLTNPYRTESEPKIYTDMGIITANIHADHKGATQDKWDYVAKVPESCHRLLPEISTETKMYILCNGSQLRYTIDKGKSWNLDTGFSKKNLKEDYIDLLDELKQSEPENKQTSPIKVL